MIYISTLDLINSVDNLAVVDSILKAEMVVGKHRKIVVSVSGGSDSDVVLDIIEKIKGNKNVEYIWFDTGMEYQATKDHLKFLEQKYGIEIHRIRAIKPIPTCVRQYGVPFLSKFVSQMINMLQRNNFEWEDKPIEELLAKYPKCASAIKWWCNWGSFNQYRIDYNKYLKEFLIKNPPTFKIDNKCCKYAKKDVAKKFKKESNADLEVIGVRRAEGGIRASSYKSCYSESEDAKVDNYRPLFWFSDEDKRYYEKHFGVTHSDCYTKYGLKRTGCVGCPYGRSVLDELESIKKYEPKLYKACMNVFGQSYEYTKKYRQFCAEMNYREKQNDDQLSLFDMYFDFVV